LILLENAIQYATGVINLCIKQSQNSLIFSVHYTLSDTFSSQTDHIVIDMSSALDPNDLKFSVMKRSQGGLGADLYVWAHRVRLAGGQCGRDNSPLCGSNGDVRYWFSIPVSNDSTMQISSSSNDTMANRSTPSSSYKVSDVEMSTSNATSVIEMKSCRQCDCIETTMSRILVVDDSAVIRKSMKKLLENMGYKIDTADDGKAALTLMEQSLYAVVFMDFEMPVMGGIESTMHIGDREMKNRQGNNGKQYIVGITASSSEELCKQGIYAGMNDYAFKPLNTELINKLIQKKNIS
jgi:CheY-like chemotaxis protein